MLLEKMLDYSNSEILLRFVYHIDVLYLVQHISSTVWKKLDGEATSHNKVSWAHLLSCYRSRLLDENRNTSF